MTNAQLYTKLSVLPSGLRDEVAEFIDFLTYKSKKSTTNQKRIAGKAKGLISLKDNFDDPIQGFEDYTK